MTTINTVSLAVINEETRADLKRLRDLLIEQAEALTALIDADEAAAPEAIQTLREKGNMLGEWAIRDDNLLFYLTCIREGKCITCAAGDPCPEHPIIED